MRAGAGSPPVRVAPVAQVVPALRTREGPVGDLVPLQPRGGGHRVDESIAIGRDVIVRRRQLVPAHPRSQSCAVLDDERIRGQVVHAGIKHRLQRTHQVRIRFPRSRVDEIRTHPGEAGRAGLRDRLEGSTRSVRALEDSKDMRRKALHSERHTREPARTQFPQHRGRHGIRVGLGRHLRPRLEAELRSDHLEDAHEVASTQERGRAAPHEDRGHGAVVRHLSPGPPDLLDHGVGVRRPAHPRTELLGRVGVEVAVAAARRTEGHVHVEAKWRMRHGRGQHSVIVLCMTGLRCRRRRTL